MIRDDADLRSRKQMGGVAPQYNPDGFQNSPQQQQPQQPQFPQQYYAAGGVPQQNYGQQQNFPGPAMPSQQQANYGGDQASYVGTSAGFAQNHNQGGQVAFSLPQNNHQQQQPHQQQQQHSSYGKMNFQGQADSGHLARCRLDNKKTMQVYSNFMYAAMASCVIGSLVALMAMGTSGGYIVWVLMVCAGSFVYMLQLNTWIMKKDDAVPEMRRISEFIRSGSEGYLRVQYNTIAVISVFVALVIGGIYMLKESPTKEVSRFTVAVLTALSFLFGAACSAIAGYIGVWVSVRVNIRVAIAASRYSYSDALLLSFRGGAVSATLSAALCILGITLLYLICHIIFVNFKGVEERHVPMLLAGYGFGSSMVALFMQLGGGIYTKAADVGADMCGKIEQNIPEDDPRNPAVIADLVGDNVGDCAGSMADVFESIAAEIIGTMILGSTLAHDAGIEATNFLFFPLVVHSFDLIISGAGIYSVYSKSDSEDPLASMQRSYGLCIVLALVCFTGICRFMLYTDVAPQAWMYFAACGFVGNVASWCLVATTTYYTDYRYAPVKGIAAASQTGHGTNVIAGMAVGLESTRNPIVVICCSILSSYYLGLNSGLPGHQAGVFGTAVATMGMLCTAVFVLSMNNFGPIADNAGGIVEMSEQPESVRVITDRLDAVGNVTKAASKGYAVGGSALACFVLFQAFMDEISQVLGRQFHVVNLAKVEVVLGGMIGIMLIFLFAGMSMTAVGNTAQKVVWEVRRQFKEKPGIMQNTELPDYNACVQIVTRAALRQMVAPSVIALTVPVAIGFFARWIGSKTGQYELGVEVVCGFMVFGTLSGLTLAIVMDNAGGAWDNAKKLIESQGSKGTLAHNAAVTGDTVGDPFKDTAGPSLHVITVTMSTTILVLGPLFLCSMDQSGATW